MDKSSKDRLLVVLSVLFLLLVVATFATYFLWKDTPALFISIGFSAIAVRLVTYLIRHFNR
ncbi:MAG: hypothetical protein SPI72_03430 [Porphyromonas sp.]|nr:hypothetical protein [Porphyromonas sp.]